jgi:uncharacterized protein (TIGR02246 family)
MRRMVTILAACAVLSLPACAREQAGAEQGSAADEQAIRALTDQYAAAWNSRDPAALSAILADDYEEVDPTGRHTVGRAAADSNTTEAMSSIPAGLQMSASTTFVKWLDEDAAIAGGTYQVTGGMPGMPTKGAWMVVAVKRDNAWKVLSSLGGGDITPMMASDTGAVMR